MILQVLLSIATVGGVIAFIAWPVLHGVDERVVDAVRAELEDAKQAKYREIKDAELDHKAGRMTEDQWLQTDRELRREAMQILEKIDTLRADKAAESGEAPTPG